MAEEKTVTGHEVPPLVVSATAENPPAQATTTTEQDRHSASQREVNMIWERTQRQLSLAVVYSSMLVGVLVVIANVRGWGGGNIQIPTIFSVAFGTVIGFYFGRTNHQTVGGVQLGR